MAAFATILELWRYPVSSMGGEQVDAAGLEPGGIVNDRRWGVVDLRDGSVAGPEGRRHWRSLPELSARLAGNLPQIGRGDGVWRDAGSAEADALLSEHLGFPAALRPHTGFEQSADGRVAPRYQRDDLHVLSTAAMEALAALVPDGVEIGRASCRERV